MSDETFTKCIEDIGAYLDCNKETIQQLRAENAELRERLACAESACSFAQAEANKYLERLAEARRLAGFYRDEDWKHVNLINVGSGFREVGKKLLPWEGEK